MAQPVKTNFGRARALVLAVFLVGLGLLAPVQADAGSLSGVAVPRLVQSIPSIAITIPTPSAPTAPTVTVPTLPVPKPPVVTVPTLPPPKPPVVTVPTLPVPKPPVVKVPTVPAPKPPVVKVPTLP